MATVHCEECGKAEDVRPSRVPKYRFCSYACRGTWRAKHWTQEQNPKWIGGVREKDCQRCGKTFQKPRRQAQCIFDERKFCSHECAVEGQVYTSGSEHHMWKAKPKRNARRGRQSSWSRAVLTRDGGVCQRCGKAEGKMHAHHIEPITARSLPGQMPGEDAANWELSSGITLCPKCHKTEHAALRAKAVNSGKLPPAKPGAEDNPEPSLE